MVARVLFPWLTPWSITIASPPTGDHKGPPNPTSTTLAPTEYPTPFREGDAYEGRSIGGGHGEPAPTFDCLQTIHTAIGFQIVYHVTGI